MTMTLTPSSSIAGWQQTRRIKKNSTGRRLSHLPPYATANLN